MSAEKVAALEALLNRVRERREEPGARLRLAFDAAAPAAAPAPSRDLADAGAISAVAQSPHAPSTRRLGGAVDQSPPQPTTPDEAPPSTEEQIAMAGTESAPEIVMEDAPAVEVSEAELAELTAEEAAELEQLDVDASDVEIVEIIEDEDTETPVDREVRVEPDVPPLPDLPPLPAEPPAQAGPAQVEPPPLAPPLADAPTQAMASAEPEPIQDASGEERAVEPPTMPRPDLRAVPDDGGPSSEVATEPKPALPPADEPVTPQQPLVDETSRSAVAAPPSASDAVTTRLDRDRLDRDRVMPPPLPDAARAEPGPAVGAERPSATLASGEVVVEPPPSPAPAPVLQVGDMVVKPRRVQPQILMKDDVGEFIAEVRRVAPATFGEVLDASLQLELR